jgi:hypothetical protein
LLSPILARIAPRPENIVQENDLLRFLAHWAFFVFSIFCARRPDAARGPKIFRVSPTPPLSTASSRMFVVAMR